jgi:hypothetical protein
MFDSLLVAMSAAKLWHLVPLLTAVSLVYAATRHEFFVPIAAHAVRFAIWIVVFMVIVFGVIQLIEWFM